MSRWARRADGNQPEIVEALRSIGCSVCPLHTVGGGVPDLLVDLRGRTVLIEIKDPKKPKSDRQLTVAQLKFHNEWTGPIYIVETIEQAIMAVTNR